MAKYGKPRSSKGLAKLCARLAEDKLARDIIIADLTSIETAPSDYFVICTCDSDLQLKAIADHISRQCKSIGAGNPKSEGDNETNWILLDFFDVVVHLMLDSTRTYYKIEKLWGDSDFFCLGSSGNLNNFKRENIRQLYHKENGVI